MSLKAPGKPLTVLFLLMFLVFVALLICMPVGALDVDAVYGGF